MLQVYYANSIEDDICRRECKLLTVTSNHGSRCTSLVTFLSKQRYRMVVFVKRFSRYKTLTSTPSGKTQRVEIGFEKG